MRRLLLSIVLTLIPALAFAQSAGSTVNNLQQSPPIVGTQLTYCPLGSVYDYKCTFAQIAAYVQSVITPGSGVVTALGKALCAAGGLMVEVQTNSQLQALPTTVANCVRRTGFFAAGDAGLDEIYTPSGSACSLNAGAGDNGSQVTSADSKCWLSRLQAETDIREFGAKCDANGSNTDDATPIAAAIAWAATGVGSVLFPATACRSSTTVTQPPGVSVRGVNFDPLTDYNVGYAGSAVVCDLSVTPCWEISQTYSGTGHVGGQHLSNLSILRAPGAISSGAECLVDQSWGTTVENVFCNGHSNGFRRYGYGSYGLISYYSNVWTCNISQSDLVLDGEAEWRLNTPRLGCNHNSSRISTHANYISITGGQAAAGPGPASLYISNPIFNDDFNPTCVINWNNIGSSYPQATEYKISGGHWESTTSGSATHTVFCSDGTLANINNVDVTDMTLSDLRGDAFALNVGSSSLTDWSFKGDVWVGFTTNGWNLNPSTAFYDIKVDDIFANALVSVAFPSGASASFNSIFSNGLTISGTPGQATFNGTMRAGTFTNSVTNPQAVNVIIPGLQNWSSYSPTLTCTAGSLTYTTTGSEYTRLGKTTSISYTINVTANSGCTGVLTLSLPTTPSVGAVANGREFGTTGFTWTGQMTAGSASMPIVAYDGTVTIAGGYKFNFISTYNNQ